MRIFRLFFVAVVSSRSPYLLHLAADIQNSPSFVSDEEAK